MNCSAKDRILRRSTGAPATSAVAVFFIIAVAMLLLALSAPCSGNEESYSFVVFGDSRIPAYVPYDRQDKDELDKLVKLVAGYAMEGQEPAYEAFFDPHTQLLERIEIPGGGEGQSRTIIYGRDGWPDVFVDRDGENAQVSLLSSGQEWVYDNVVRELDKGAADPGEGPAFCLHTGDIVYFGFQGKSAEVSPYWQDFNRRFLSRLPGGGPDGLPARFFPVLGNHETWGDSDIVGFRELFPYLEQYGFDKDRRVYFFDYRNARFAFLDSGIMNPAAPDEWYKSTPGYQEQMDLLKGWLDDAVKKGQDHFFLTFHYPVFCRSGFGPLPPKQNPHDLLKSYAGKIDITVFTGHVHATEAYRVDGVRYFIAGGGGGEQSLSVKTMPGGYPEDVYWQGKPRKLDFNYLVVKVMGKDVEVTLKRFRPNEFEPFAQVNIVPGLMN